MSFIVEDLDPSFTAHLAILKSVSEDAESSVCALDQRSWYLPPGMTSTTLSNIPGISEHFNRDDINDAYISVVSDTLQNGRQGEAMLLKLQLDYIAALERSFRTRHMSPVRARIHAAGRRYGHGASGGLFDPSNGSIAVWLQRMLTAAHSDS